MNKPNAKVKGKEIVATKKSPVVKNTIEMKVKEPTFKIKRHLKKREIKAKDRDSESN